MTAQLIDGKSIAASLRQQIAQRVAERRQQGLRTPGLAVILVGDDPASATYVKNKVKACADAGVRSVLEKYDADLTEDALKKYPFGGTRPMARVFHEDASVAEW